jgi:hypothetical protein
LAAARNRSGATAQSTGEQERAGAGVESFAGHVDKCQLEPLALVGKGRHEEVATEARAACRPLRKVRRPARRQHRELPLLPQLVTELQQHRLAAACRQAQPLAVAGELHREDSDEGEDDGRTRPGILPAGVGDLGDERRGDDDQQDAQRRAFEHDARDHDWQREAEWGRHADAGGDGDDGDDGRQDDESDERERAPALGLGRDEQRGAPAGRPHARDDPPGPVFAWYAHDRGIA